MLGYQHHTETFSVRDTGQTESKKGQLSPCDFRVFHAMGVSPLGPSLLSPKLCLWFPFGERLVEMQGKAQDLEPGPLSPPTAPLPLPTGETKS